MYFGWLQHIKMIKFDNIRYSIINFKALYYYYTILVALEILSLF